jgi:hypothetical protein
MAALFDRDRSVISRHLKDVFETKELARKSVVAKNATTAADGKTYQVEYYNLDAVLSVGYRVNSKRGTQFRLWATQTLKEHLTHGYTINRRRLEQNARELEAALQLIRKTASRDALTADEGRGPVDIIARYTQTFLLLQRYDEGLLTEPKGKHGGDLPSIGEARKSIATLKANLMARGEADRCSGRSGRKRSFRFSVTWECYHTGAFTKPTHRRALPADLRGADAACDRTRGAMSAVSGPKV